MLDAILLPIGEGNRILAQISSGKIDELIAQTYKGDHEKMKQAVNNVGRRPAGSAKRTGAADRRIQRRPALRARQAGAFPGRLCRDRARRQHHAGRHPAADRGRQPHSGANLQRQDRRADRADLQRRSRKDEAGRQQRGGGAARPAEGTGAPDRGLQGRKANRARQSGAVPGRVLQHRARRERHSGRGDHAAQCGRQLRGSHQQGRSAAADHRYLSRRIQHHQEQPEHADQRHGRGHARGRRDRAGQSHGRRAGAQRPGQTDAGSGQPWWPASPAR